MSTPVEQALRAFKDPAARAKAANELANQQQKLSEELGDMRDVLVYRAVDSKYAKRYGWNLLAQERAGMSNGLWYRTLKRRKDTNHAIDGNPHPKYVLPKTVPSEGYNLDDETQLFDRIKGLHTAATAAIRCMKDAIQVRQAALGELFAAEANSGRPIDNVAIADAVGMKKQEVGKARAAWRERQAQLSA